MIDLPTFATCPAAGIEAARHGFHRNSVLVGHHAKIGNRKIVSALNYGIESSSNARSRHEEARCEIIGKLLRLRFAHVLYEHPAFGRRLFANRRAHHWWAEFVDGDMKRIEKKFVAGLQGQSGIGESETRPALPATL
jgi:hypothetical protein